MSDSFRVSTTTKSRGFTLIELLIVVAIIAILSAIAVPNFLEAQVRSKVARVKADIRTIATGLEQYAVDYNGYQDIFTRMQSLTTPTAYLSALPHDIFRLPNAQGPGGNRRGLYRYGAMPFDHPSRYVLASNGPDTDIDTYFEGQADNDQTTNADWQADNLAMRWYPGWNEALFSDAGWVPGGLDPGAPTGAYKYIEYDSTNGSVSNGDVFRFSDHQAK